MNETPSPPRSVLYVITCGSSSAPRVPGFVELAQAAGWDVCVIVTPHATKFVDVPLLVELTGHPVRSEYKHPEEPDVLPRADALVAFPVTFNSLNKWALGISDTLAIGLLCEYTGLNMPILAIPGVASESGLDTHPAFLRSMRLLKKYGVHVIYEPEKYPPANNVPWQVILDELHRIYHREKDSEMGDDEFSYSQ